MKTGLGLVLATSALLAFGACASGGGSGGTTGTTATTGAGIEGAERLEQGESPRENEQTEAADNQIDQAENALESGDTATAQTHYRQAADAAEQAIAMDARNPLPWLQGGIANMGLGNYEAADSMLAEAQELRPIYQFDINPMREQRWIELYQQAAPLVNAGEYEAAAEVFADAHAIYRQRPEVMLTLGQIYAQLGNYDEAIEILREGLAIVNDEEATAAMDSSTVASWEEQAAGIPAIIAQSLMNAGRDEEAADALRELVAANPENMAYRRNLANLYVRMEIPDSAEAIYEDLLDRGGLSSTELYQIGIGFYQMSSYDRAAEAFEEAVAQAPRDRDAAEMWARSLQIGHPPGGEETDTTPEPILQELKQAGELWLELDPYSQNAHIILAQTENRLGNQQRAAELIRAVEGLPVVLDQLQLQRMAAGGGRLTGIIQNVTMDEGSQVTLDVTFYGDGAAPLGSESVTVNLPAQDATQSFEVVLESEEQVTGFTYSVEGV